MLALQRSREGSACKFGPNSPYRVVVGCSLADEDQVLRLGTQQAKLVEVIVGLLAVRFDKQ